MWLKPCVRLLLDCLVLTLENLEIRPGGSRITFGMVPEPNYLFDAVALRVLMSFWFLVACVGS